MLPISFSCSLRKLIPRTYVLLSRSAPRTPLLLLRRRLLNTLSHDECDVCPAFAKAAFMLLRGQRDVASSAQAIDRACHYVGQAQAPQCAAFINRNAAALIPLLIKVNSPDQLCPRVPSCAAPAAQSTLVDTKVRVVKSRTALQAEIVSKAAPSNRLCGVCELVVDGVEHFLTDNKTETEIEKVLDSVCSKLPAAFSDSCQTFVNTYLPELATFLENEEDGAQLCGKLNVCPAKREIDASDLEDAEGMEAGLDCELCHVVLDVTETLVGEERTHDNVRVALTQSCGKLEDLEGACNDMLDKYGAILVDQLVQYVDSNAICQHIKMCSADDFETEIQPEGGILCSLCEAVVGWVDKEVGSNKTEAAIEAALDKVCKVLGPLDAPCEAFVNAYAPDLIQLLLKESDPTKVCGALGVCKNSTAVVEKKAVEPEGGILCSLCEADRH
eukprot:TRINITY_DN322_c0_g1_i7.p1 TRINITY_DN322_c0_g1~~TRINITY_DN322_c0_g1_i7.p1  ORF type:complete len:443 (+),score=82.91 TRINITY_DN322_c0_g1_i7:670-1998(+)